MRKKICILGGIGYIGGALCNLYKNNKKDEIIVIDNRFIHERVEWLVEHNFRYFQRDIFNIKDLISDADIVYNLVSITDVPQTAAQATKEKDDLILKIGVDGNREVINNIKDDCKVVFTSTHVVHEGEPAGTKDITEDREPKPLLAYSRSKYIGEQDYFASNKNFVIARLSSVYGRSPNMRVNIVTNLFGKFAALNQKIRVFNPQCQKPIVGVNDVAAALKMLTKSKYNREIYNIVNEHKTIEELAQICVKYNPKLEVETVLDSNGSLGYTMSNKKILSTGFRFRQTIEEEISRMIKIWSNKC